MLAVSDLGLAVMAFGGLMIAAATVLFVIGWRRVNDLTRDDA